MRSREHLEEMIAGIADDVNWENIVETLMNQNDELDYKWTFEGFANVSASYMSVVDPDVFGYGLPEENRTETEI